MKSHKILLIFLSLNFFASSKDLIFKGIRCKADSNWICIQQCYISDTQALNIAGNTYQLIAEPIKVHVVVLSGDGSNVYLNEDFQAEWCSLMKADSFIPVITSAKMILSSKIPSIIQECPYNGTYEVRNFKIDQDMIFAASALTPTGKFKLKIDVLKNDNVILNIVIDLESTPF